MAHLRGVGQADDWSDEYFTSGDYSWTVGGEEIPSIGQEPSILDTIFKTGQRAVELWMSYDTRKELMDLNLQRAQRGLPPIDAAAYLQSTAPQVRVGVAADTQKMLIYGAGALALVFIGSALLKR